ncbi:hypothetical protein [Marinobacter zhejiangensis]|uniref:Uncharacterized protein n=1 Tax=Marinobacter zhejiangensis TaxID=488535 RepID=A0A1I4MB26_9GAMM|nr:hypothetical protein [Marinobacter zhejiangensis]SFM00235.1 hypothetical protein SAMN04487963_0956 [Marinobacter zhejiangensis]
MTFPRRFLRYFLTLGSAVLLLLGPALVSADDELDVTMRMVTDDEALSESFVQQLELPDTLRDRDSFGFDGDYPGRELAVDALDTGREVGEALAEQDRESRDALDVELPGETIDTSPVLDLPLIDGPGLDLPILGEPGLPVIEVPDLPLINEENLTDGNLLDNPLIDGKL